MRKVTGEQRLRPDEMNDVGSARELLRAFEACPSAVIIVDSAGRIAYANGFTRELLGCPPDLLVGKQIDDPDMPFVRPDGTHLPQQEHPVAIALQKSRETAGCEIGVIGPDGKLKILTCNTTPILSEDGATIGAAASFLARDVSEHKRAREALESKEQLLRQFVESTPAAVAMFDTEMRYIIASKRWKVDYHLGEQNIIGRSHYDVFPDIPARWKEIHRRCLAGVVERVDEDRFERADGGIEWIKWEIQPWRDDEGTIGGIIMFTEVITERKREHEALRDSELFIHSVLDSLSAHIAILDADGTISYTNRAWQNFAADNGLRMPPGTIGVNYLAVCDQAVGPGAGDASAAATGIRKVISGKRGDFLMEYECIAESVPRYFNLRVTRVAGAEPPQVVVAHENITQAKLASEALRESEDKYRSLVERANDGITVIQGGIIKFVNAEFVEMGGYRADELEGQPFLNFIPPDVLPTIQERYRRRMAGEDVPAIYETVLETKTGAKVDVEINAGVIPFQGSPADLVMVRDITERKRAEHELREIQDRLQGISDNSPAVIYLKDIQGRLILVNNQYEKIARVSRQEMLGKTEEAFLPPEVAEEMRANDRKVMEAGTPMTFEEQAPLEGRVQTFLSVKFPLRDSSGAIYGVGGISTDITDRKASEDALAKSEARYRELVEDISDWVWEVDKEGRYTYSSPVAERILGYRPDEMIGTPILDSIIPDDRESSKEAFDEAIARGAELVSLPNRNQHKDGTIRYLETSASPILDDGGRVTGMRGIDRDVTDRVLAEEEKRRFYRTAIFSLTDGKLEIVSPEEARATAEQPEVTVVATTPREASEARSAVRDMLRRHGLPSDRLAEFIIAVGEAVNNSVKHAGRGVITAGARDGVVWVSVCDSGPGIDQMTLPRVALEKGFSTKPSLGLGYSIILDAADKVRLSTGPDGTQVVMEKNIAAPKPMAPLLDRLPDTW